MALTFLDRHIISPTVVRDRRRILTTDTINFFRTTVHTGAQRWELDVTMQPSNDQVETRNSWSHRIEKGFSDSFEFPMPQLYGIADALDAASALSPSSDQDIGETTIPLTTTSEDWFIPAGYFVKFSNHAKVYLVTSDANSSSNSPYTGNLNIYPALTTAITTSTTLTQEDVDITVYYDTKGDHKLTFQSGIWDETSFSLVEAL